MKHLGLLFLTGCQLVFPRDDISESSGVELRTTFTTVDQNDRLVFDGDGTLQQGDLVIAAIQARTIDNIRMTDSSLGWSLIADEQARGCPAMFHVWLMRTIVNDDTSFDFTFSEPDEFSVLVTAYRGASSATLMDFALTGVDLDIDDDEYIYDADTVSPSSIIYIGGGANQPWADLNAPDEGERLDSIQNLAAYQLGVADGEVPEIGISITNGFCADIAQIKVEP